MRSVRPVDEQDKGFLSAEYQMRGERLDPQTTRPHQFQHVGPIATIITLDRAWTSFTLSGLVFIPRAGDRSGTAPD